MDMGTGMNLTFVKTALDDFQLPGRDKCRHNRKLLAPLPQSREKELNDVYCKVQNEIKQIKDDVLNDLADGGAVDYEKIKSLFEKAELEIQEKKKDILFQFNTKAAVVSSSNIISDYGTPKLNMQTSSSIVNVNATSTKDHQITSGTAEVDRNLSRKVIKKNQISTSTNVSTSQKVLDIEKLRNIINPIRKDTQFSLFNENSKLAGIECRNSVAKPARSQMKPITGSTISHPQFDHLSSSKPTSPPPSCDDARKGILNLIQRKMIPAASSLTIVPSPIKHQQVVLHEPSNKRLNKHEPRSQYNLALVKFDKFTLDSTVDIHSGKPNILSNDPSNSVSSLYKKSSSQELPEMGSSRSPNSMGGELSTLKTLFPFSSNEDCPSHHFIIKDGRCVQDTQDFIHFKQYYCLSWNGISRLLGKIEKLMTDYSVPVALISGDRLADMSLYFEIGPKPTMKDLLMCVLNNSEVEKVICIPGRRYLAEDGKDMAAIRIQARWCGYHQRKIYREGRRKKWAAGLIAVTWIMNCKLTYIKKHLKQKYIEYLNNNQNRMKIFKQEWPKIKSSKRLIIHIPSLGYPVAIRSSLPNLPSLQNCQMGRIFDIRDPNVEVIYICPLNIDQELLEYYNRLVEVMSSITKQDFKTVSERLKIMVPENLNKFTPHNLCLSSSIKYSDNLIDRLKCMTKGKNAYIVPGFMHKDDLYIADKLDIPILGCEPDIAHLYSLKSGVHRIFESAEVERAPGVHDIYTRQQFDQSLAKLVTQNLHITRWLFKIDNHFDGRGTAYCDITENLECFDHALKEAARYGEEWKERWAHESVYNVILRKLPDILEKHATPVDKSVFQNWQEFMLGFLGEGGIIEACPPTDSVTGITGNVLIEPDGAIKILNVADQVHSSSPYKCWGYTLPQSSFDVGILNECIMSIGNACKARGVVGYFTVDCVTYIDPESDAQVLWAVGLKLGYSDSHAMIHTMTSISDCEFNTNKNRLEVIVQKTAKRPATYQSKYKKAKQVKEKLTERQQRFAVVSSKLFHSNLNNIAYSVLFQICKANGIAFDDKMKIGTTFTLVNHTKRELMGMMAMGESLQDAVSSFALNLVSIHNNISTMNMAGRNNFQGAIDDLKSVLEALRINLEINQNKYPTMDPKDRRYIQSACNVRSDDEDDDDSTIRCTRSAGFTDGIESELLLIDEFSLKTSSGNIQ